MTHSDPAVAFIFKGFPRLSETFIVNEIRWLRRLGLAVELFSIKQGDALADDAELPEVAYCPQTGTMSGVSLWRWLRAHWGAFEADQTWWLKNHPLRWMRVAGFALRNAVRYRKAGNGVLKKTFIKEFLLAGHIARLLQARPHVQHLHAHFCHDATTVCWMVSQLTGIPFSFTAHAKDIYQEKLNPGDLLSRKLAATRFVATCTLANVAHLRTLTRNPEKIHGQYHGLDTAMFRPSDAPRSATRLISVGRHVEKKGFIYLLEACRVLRERGVAFELDIVGEPDSETPAMSDYIAMHGLAEQVRLLPPVRQAELTAYYHNAAAFVLPCIVLADGDRDGIPNVMAEAMACGLPVVVTGISGIPEMVTHEQSGLIVPERDAQALADAIQRVLADELLRKALGIAGRARVERVFDARETHVQLLELFHCVLHPAATRNAHDMLVEGR